MLRDILNRIDQRLDVVGLSESKAAKLAGLSDSAIRDMRRAVKRGRESGGVSTRTINALAPVLQTTPAWLLEAVGDEDAGGDDTVPLVGYVGAGDAAHFYAVSQGELDRVPAPKNGSKNTVASEIRGESMGPLLNRWLVYYDEVRSPVTHDMLGTLCVVGLADDRVLVKKIKQTPRSGLYDLESNSGEKPIRAVAIIWAAKVRSIEPR